MTIADVVERIQDGTGLSKKESAEMMKAKKLFAKNPQYRIF
jgi:hypothetical protein